ncbi:MAG: S41 family peptidase [Bacteroidetes bacterium]|nr:S41 family peptidase [Bacteroidota bacterium]
MNQPSSRRLLLLPLVLGIVLASGIYLGSSLAPTPKVSADNKINTILDYIQQEYVDTINRKTLVDQSIEKLLEQLDPHSAYIPAEDLQSANEPLEGNFEGIGIEFHIQQDSIMVVSAISGGPSERVGLMAGDRIVKVNGKQVAGNGITNEQVLKTLRGKGGTPVTVSVYRRGQKALIDFKIIRGKIPINSLDISYMADESTGFIKISRFSATTYDEFMAAMSDLKQQGLRNLILDMRGNPGGFLDAATNISDELIGGKKLIVYTKGKARPRTSYYTKRDGIFEEGRLMVLIDEGSASASEIVAGAIQDWDRGTILGRRSFGKGLVQEQTELSDGSAIRLTIARYYTPTGRSIQKPYEKGVAEYEEELYSRFKHGELLSKDSIQFADSLKFKTPAGRTVYGGGGIMPDVFVPIDTSYETAYLNSLFASGSVNQFAYDYVDQHRSELKKYDAASYKKLFEINTEIIRTFTSYASERGVPLNEKELNRSLPFLKTQLKAAIARQVWKNEGMYPILHEKDATFQRAMSLIKQST